MPPKEWSKNRGQQEARQKSSIAPSSRPPDPDPGKRFFLDWLL